MYLKTANCLIPFIHFLDTTTFLLQTFWRQNTQCCLDYLSLINIHAQFTFTNKLTWINCKTTGIQRFFDVETTEIQSCEVLQCCVLAELKTEQSWNTHRNFKYCRGRRWQCGYGNWFLTTSLTTTPLTGICPPNSTHYRYKTWVSIPDTYSWLVKFVLTVQLPSF